MNYFEALSGVLERHPDLLFNNDGYERLSPKIVEANKSAIEEIEKLLRESVVDFVSFQNFKPRKDGSITVRCQTRWAPWFTGVTYIPLDNFKPESKTWRASEDETDTTIYCG
jgi:hypothetical protein